MQLTSIAAKNYRTLQDLTLRFEKNYCTISGRNNAGKSCVIRLLSCLFQPGTAHPWSDAELIYKEDKTQWVKQSFPIEVVYTINLTKGEDPALVSFIERIATKKIEHASAKLGISYSISESDVRSVSVDIDGERVDEKAGKEIDKRIKDSNLLFLYNSTAHEEAYYFGRGRRRLFYDFVMSAAEKKTLDEAGKYIEKSLRKLAKQHTDGLREVLGRLTEKYDVDVSPPEGLGTSRMPLGINLRDRNVEVPLGDWGSGTQNRTRILMAILQASRIKTTGSSDEKITPFVVIEEPESFLHPSAQAEFGRMLSHLSGEFGIQIIVTTHSPYMLNQEEPAANLLLSRTVKRNKALGSILVETSGDSWMAPFADHLGIGPSEFANLRPLFAAGKSKVLLVEGQIDLEYFGFLKQHGLLCDQLGSDIEVVPYGGKDTLKNTLLVQFVLRKFDMVFVTYDLAGC
jgi:predicted ATP-dependent endonuclease of OLD family